MNRRQKTLVLGYGNPARGDDGLGPALIKRLAQLELNQIETRLDYQLRVEDALDIGDFCKIIFIDASKNANPPFEYQQLDENQPPADLNTHSISPRALIYLARTLFKATTPAYIMAIRGYHFEPFDERLSAQAHKNLNLAVQYLLSEIDV